jgi:hypothetical protein
MRGLPNILGSELDFHRIDFQVRHSFMIKKLGITSLEAKAGKVWGDVPYAYLFNGRANTPTESFTQWNIFVADQYSFETMLNNEFLNSEYVQLMFRQNFESRFLKIKSFAPQIEWMVRGLWGTLNNADQHKGIAVKSAVAGFYETGIEINRLLGSTGLGVYYRFGPNALPDVSDNFAIKLTTRLVLFQ